MRGAAKLALAIIDFNYSIQTSELNEIPSKDNTSTQNNRRQGSAQEAERLDRFFSYDQLPTKNSRMTGQLPKKIS